jgi:DNA-directed RNA polymerase specialized sigma subunit
MDNHLSEEDIRDLIVKIKAGSEEAWERFYENFEDYVHECAWKRLRMKGLSYAVKTDMEKDLFQAGWLGFIYAVKNFIPERGKFLTYATYYINGDISKELDRLSNPMGLTDRPVYEETETQKWMISKVPLDDAEEMQGSELAEKLAGENEVLSVDNAPDRGKYPAERRALQIMYILKAVTDEDHSLSKAELGRLLILYRTAKYKNSTAESPNALTSTIQNMLLELDPEEYSEDKESKYRIRYEGFKENRLKEKLDGMNGKKSGEITGFSYAHTFNHEELDTLIQLVCFSDMIGAEEKRGLVEKLISTASRYYSTPFWNGDEIRFNPHAVHGRLSTRKSEEKVQFIQNMKTIRHAVNNLVQIKFRFDHYTAEGVTAPDSDRRHVLSPYHLVVYHDNYYCIGLKKDDKRIWHYRVDLMSDVEIVKDDSGKALPAEITAFEGTPICNAAWDPEKYMAEHLYMAYDDPQDIRIKIRDTDHTIIHDWFGNHYEKTDEACEEGYDIVKVRTSPAMIVHWAMQYGTAVEILNEEIREKIREEAESIAERYSAKGARQSRKNK